MKCGKIAICLYTVVTGFAWLTSEVRAQDNDHRQDIHFDDLHDSYRVVGRLEIPVGTYATIRGIWRRSDSWPASLEFHVFDVDGRRLKNTVIYPPFLFHHGGPYPFDVPLAKPKDLEVWEIRVYERILTYGTPKTFREEVGLPVGVGAFLAERFKSNTERVYPFELASTITYHRKPRVLQYSDLASTVPQSEVRENVRADVDRRRPIDFEELRDRYRIIGRLGKPVGEYATVSGVWTTQEGCKRVQDQYLRITHV